MTKGNAVIFWLLSTSCGCVAGANFGVVVGDIMRRELGPLTLVNLIGGALATVAAIAFWGRK